MSIFNYYSISHFFIWFGAGRFTLMNWKLFLLLSLSWELLELFLPFGFAQEILLNKFGDILVNIAGFYLGTHLREGSRR